MEAESIDAVESPSIHPPFRTYRRCIMRTLPLADPGTPDLRSPGKFMLWIAREQLGLMCLGVFYGIVWMVASALGPALVGEAIDRGVTRDDPSALVLWSGLLLGAGVAGAVAGVLRHRVAVTNWLTGAYRVQQLLVRHAVRLGGTLPRRISTGEVVSVAAHDVERIGSALDVTARLAGAVVSFFVVGLLMLRSSVMLGFLVLIGVPLVSAAIGPILRPLHARQADQRELVGELTTLGADTVSGLRVLRGIGGEEEFSRRYAAASQDVRRAGVRVGAVRSVLDSTQVALPGIFVVTVTWLGARLAVAGRITVGELVAFYGYAAFLLIPVRTATEAADKFTRAHVGARRIIRVLGLEPQLDGSGADVTEPPADAELVDVRTGLVVRPGVLTAVVAADPQDATGILERLGRFADDSEGARFGAVALDDLRLSTVRRRIVVSDHDPRLFTGPLDEELDPTGSASRDRVLAALHAASAEDVLDALPQGLATEVEERGRSFSGGQRQRLVLTRALVADPDVLLLDEPTSSVDAHTEARIGQRLRGFRHGRTTVVCTTSPLLLECADRVALVLDGHVISEGTHRELMHTDPRYRSVVVRGEDS